MTVFVDWRFNHLYNSISGQLGEIYAMLGLPTPRDTRFVNNRTAYVVVLVLDIAIGIAAYLYGEIGIAWLCGIGAVVGLIYIIVGSVIDA